MRIVAVNTFMSLDGVMQAPGGPEEDPTGGSRTAARTGVTINTYVRAGDINPGSMDFDQPTDAELERRQRLAAA